MSPRVRLVARFLLLVAGVLLGVAWILALRAGAPTSLWLSIGLAGVAGGVAFALLTRLRRERLRVLKRFADSLGGRAPDASISMPFGDDEEEDWRVLSRSIHGIPGRFEGRILEERSLRERFETVIASLEEAFLVVDPDGRVIFANSRAGELFAMPDEPAGIAVLEVVREPNFLDALETALAGRATGGELRIGAADPLSIRFRITPFEVGGDFGGAVALFHDISELRRAEAVRNDFLANASHEIKTPLSAVRGYAELLADREIADPTSKKAIEAILGNSKRLTALVEDLLELSEIESGGVAADIRRFDAADVVHGLLRDLEARAKAGQLRLDAQCEGDTEIHNDRRAFEQVVTNLVDNALKYTPSEGAVRVDVGPASDPDRLRVSVTDTGPGISLRHRDRVFERFYRVDPGRSREVGGTGLGLAIVKHLVQEGLAGEVGVESEPGEGSCFWFELPRVLAPSSGDG